MHNPVPDLTLEPVALGPCACGKVPNLDAWSQVIRRKYPSATAEEIIVRHTPARCIPWAQHEAKP